MNLEQYKIIQSDGMSLEEATKKLKRKLIQLCKDGWKLQGGASVNEKQYPQFMWYDVYQTMIPGEQKISDYNIVKVTSFIDNNLSDAAEMMRKSIINSCGRKWKLQGGASVDISFIEDNPSGMVHTIFQTIIKE